MTSFKFHACTVSFENLKTEKSVSWSGFVITKEKEYYLLTTFHPLTSLLTTQQLSSLDESSTNSLPSNLLRLKLSITTLNQKDNKNKTKLISSIVIKNDSLILFKSLKLENILKDNMSMLDDQKNSCFDQSYLKFFCWFVIIRLTTESCSLDSFSFGNLKTLSNKLYTGKTVKTMSFPFGSDHTKVFQGCCSKGIVSNLIDNALIVTDARCLPGSEGGLIYNGDEFFGIILSPLYVESGQLSGFSIGCTGYEIFKSLDAELDVNSLSKKPSLYNSSNHNGRETGPMVVKIKTGSTLGSGVVCGIKFDENQSVIYIVTCNHVVVNTNLYKTLGCFFTSENNTVISSVATVIYKSKSNYFDLAILHFRLPETKGKYILSIYSPWFKKIESNAFMIRYSSNYFTCDKVNAKGHAFFDRYVPPFVSCGIISKIIKFDSTYTKTTSMAGLVHTTCNVVKGISGGALYLQEKPVFLGIIVCNIDEVQDQKVILYPNISFVLPSQLFMPAIHELLLGQSKWKSTLDEVIYDYNFQQTWKIFNASVLSKL